MPERPDPGAETPPMSLSEEKARLDLGKETGVKQVLEGIDPAMRRGFAEHGQMEYDDWAAKPVGERPEVFQDKRSEEMTPAELERAYAMNTEMGFAAAQAKSGRIEQARRTLEAAHQRGEEAVQLYQERSKGVDGKAEEATKQVQALLAEGKTGRIDIEPEHDLVLDRQMDTEIQALIGASAEPVAVIRHDDRKAESRYTDVIYSASASSKLAYRVRYLPDGQVVERTLLATDRQAFRPSRLRGEPKPMEEVKRLADTAPPSLPEPEDFSDLKRSARRERAHHVAEKIAATAWPVEVPSQQGRERPLSTYQPVTDRLSSAGYDEATIAAITRRKKGKAAKPRRRGFWAGLFGN